VTDTGDIIHQIEYRWHDRRDLSPVATTMSPESLRAWDSWIRTWVRHPHVDRLEESVCYQVLPNGRAALAWRYEDWQAAERHDGRRGRPLVSRVLAGQLSLLPPEVAITLCRTGPPATAGPRPGQVTTENKLSVIRAEELSRLVSEQTAGLDEEAARQDSLRQVVAAALSHPHTPLAIHIRDGHILEPPEEGLPCLLLWGLRRITWPLLANAGRGWSFSTFELPLGDIDPAVLPDILFRQAQDAPTAAPAMPRDEVKIRPFDTEAPGDPSPYAEMAAWLVAEYRERGGDELRQLITEWCEAEQSLMRRLEKVYGQLLDRHSPVVVHGSPAPFVPVSSGRTLEREADTPGPARLTQYTTGAADESAPVEAERTQMPAPYEALDQSGTAPERETPEQEAEASRAVAAEVSRFDHDLAPQNEQHRSDPLETRGWPQPYSADGAAISPYPDPSQHARRREDENDFGGSRDREYDPLHRAYPGAPGDFPYPDASARPPQPDAGPQPGLSAQPDLWPQSDVSPQSDFSPQSDASSERLIPYRTAPGYSSRTWSDRGDDALGYIRREGEAPRLPQKSQNLPVSTRGRQLQTPASQPVSVSGLLKKLPAMKDAQEFLYVLRDILSPDSKPELNDRVTARREMFKKEWYSQIYESFGDLLDSTVLSEIFQIVVIPDLDDSEVARKIADWADYAQPPVIGGLLTAAKDSGNDIWQLMMQILQPKLAQRWTVDNYMAALWDSSLAPQAGSHSGRGRFGLKRR
jgi:hypothetical protein